MLFPDDIYGFAPYDMHVICPRSINQGYHQGTLFHEVHNDVCSYWEPPWKNYYFVLVLYTSYSMAAQLLRLIHISHAQVMSHVAFPDHDSIMSFRDVNHELHCTTKSIRSFSKMITFRILGTLLIVSLSCQKVLVELSHSDTDNGNAYFLNNQACNYGCSTTMDAPLSLRLAHP